MSGSRCAGLERDGSVLEDDDPASAMGSEIEIPAVDERSGCGPCKIIRLGAKVDPLILALCALPLLRRKYRLARIKSKYIASVLCWRVI